MNRLLTCTALGLILAVSPAMAQVDEPVDQQPAAEAPAPAEPMDMPALQDEPMHDTAPLAQDEPLDAPDQAAEAPAAVETGATFVSEQRSGDYLARNEIIGKTVYNEQDESLGDINDLVANEDGNISAALIGVGGFLGIGEREVAVNFEDLQFTRDENGDLRIMLGIDRDTLAAAPEYDKLDDHQVATDGGATAPADGQSDY
jgi:sporulation protein YlmC with PRC-barrel domain